VATATEDRLTMKKLLLAGVVLFLATGAAYAAEVKPDILLVVLKEDNGKN